MQLRNGKQLMNKKTVEVLPQPPTTEQIVAELKILLKDAASLKRWNDDEARVQFINILIKIYSKSLQYKLYDHPKFKLFTHSCRIKAYEHLFEISKIKHDYVSDQDVIVKLKDLLVSFLDKLNEVSF